MLQLTMIKDIITHQPISVVVAKVNIFSSFNLIDKLLSSYDLIQLYQLLNPKWHNYLHKIKRSSSIQLSLMLLETSV